MSFSSGMQIVADRLLSTYGEIVDISRPNVLFVDPTTGTATEGSPTYFSGHGHPSLYEEQYVDNVTILNTDIKLLLYSTSEPIAGDILTINETNYTAINVQRVRAQTSNIYYIIQLRQ